MEIGPPSPQPSPQRGEGVTPSSSLGHRATKADFNPAGSLSKQRRHHFGWREISLAFLIVFLAYQVVIPFVMIIWTSLKTALPGEPEFVSLTFTLSNYARAFG